MNLFELERRLIAAARQNPPSSEVPYGFVQRVMAHLKSAARVDQWAFWSRGLWRAAAACLAVMVVSGAFALLVAGHTAADSSRDLSQAFENTLLATVDQETVAPQ